MNNPMQTVVRVLQPIWQPFLLSDDPPPHFYLAVSGGMDSMVLLDAWYQSLMQAPKSGAEKILQNTRVLHIHHGLQSEAAQWLDFCQQQAAHYGFAFYGVQVNIVAEKLQKLGLEQAAREARQQVFRERLQDGDYLLTAHHQQDQAETLLLNLFRGSGVAGLQGMQTKRYFRLQTGVAKMCRPFLELSHNLLYRYAQAQKLSWQEDPSNRDLKFRRNFVRHQLLPIVKSHWPKAEVKLAETAHWMQEANTLLSQLAEQDLASCQSKHLPASNLMSETHWLTLESLKALTLARQKNTLRHWIAQVTGLAPSAQQLQNILQQIVNNPNPQAQPKIQMGCWWARGFQNRLFLLKNSGLQNKALGDVFKYLVKDKRFQVHSTELENLSKLNWQAYQQAKQSPSFTASDRYKKWFQQNKIPPWQRVDWPGAWLGEQYVLAGMSELKGIHYSLE